MSNFNRYLQKIASSTDLQIAQKSHGEESKAVHDYTQRLKDAKSPELKKAIEHARSEEKDHAEGFRKIMDKAAELREEFKSRPGTKVRSKLVKAKKMKPAKAIKPKLNKQ